MMGADMGTSLMERESFNCSRGYHRGQFKGWGDAPTFNLMRRSESLSSTSIASLKRSLGTEGCVRIGSDSNGA